VRDAKAWADLIDNYQDTIHCMVGFGNLYRYDDANHRMHPAVELLQGWRFDPRESEPGSRTNVTDATDDEARPTPDLAILAGEDTGVVAEVKTSFPQQREHWADDFDQLRSYDWELTGWPTASGRVKHYDLVLLTHQTRSTAVRDYYLQAQSNGKHAFVCPFAIVEFNRSDQRQPYLFFRKMEGYLSEQRIDERLRGGRAGTHGGVAKPI
jgi:hypothetical protein